MRRELRVLLLAVTALSLRSSLGAAQPPDEPIVISGRVVNGQDLPVAEATVQAIPNRAAVPVTTDPSGKFTISVPASSAAAGLLIVANDRADRLGTFRILRQEEREPPSDIRIVLGETRSLEVSVCDQSGRPLSGATVGAAIDRVALPFVKTGPLGTASLKLPLHAGSLVIYAYQPGHGFDYRTIEWFPRRAKGLELPAGQPFTLTLGQTTKMEVRAKTEDGRPAVGLTFRPWLLQKPKESLLTLCLMPGIYSAVTDAQGIAHFNDLPEWATTDVIAFWTDAVPRRFLWERAKHRESVFEVVIPRVVPMSGRVEFADGTPAAGIVVEVLGGGDDTRPFQVRTTSYADGRFAIDVLPDEVYVVGTDDQKWAAAPLAGIIARPGKPVENLTLTVRPTALLHGQLTAGNDRQPVANQALSLDQQVQLHIKRGDFPHPNNFRRPISVPSAPRRWALTDREGRYQFRVGPGSYLLNGRSILGPKKVELRDEKELTVDLTARVRGRGLLSGTVVDAASGKPVPGATVFGIYCALSCGDGDELLLVADSAGKFRGDRQLVPMMLHASSPDGKLAALVKVGADDSAATITLKPLGTARGQIVRAASGDPVANATIDYSVRVYMGSNAGAGKMWRSSFGGVTVTRSKGRFDLASLIADQQYEIVASTAGSRQSIGEVQVESPSVKQLGPLAFPEPRRPKLNELIRQALSGDPQQKYKSAQQDAQSFRQRVVLLFIDPKSPPCRTLMELLAYDEVQAAMIDYADPIVVDVTGEPGKALAKSLKVSLTSGLALPYLVLRDAQGGPLAVYSKEEIALGGAVDRSRLVEVLRGNAAEPLDTRKLLDGALAQARKTNRRVLLLEATPASGPSHKLVHFLESHRPIWEKAFILVRVDPRWNNSRVVMDGIRRGAGNEVPWMAVLDGDAHPVITSRTDQGNNIGFPEEPDEIDHFVKMLKTGSNRWTVDDSQKLRAALVNQPH